jgi:hypothetical protein
MNNDAFSIVMMALFSDAELWPQESDDYLTA